MAKIGMETLSAATDLVGSHLQDLATEINSAFGRAGGKELPVSIKLFFKPEIGGGVQTRIKVKFLPCGPVVAESHILVHETQAKLFPKNGDNPDV